MNDNAVVLPISLASQKPTLTLALSRRERGLTEVDVRETPTWDTESYAGSERPTNRLPLQGRGLG